MSSRRKVNRPASGREWWEHNRLHEFLEMFIAEYQLRSIEQVGNVDLSLIKVAAAVEIMTRQLVAARMRTPRLDVPVDEIGAHVLIGLAFPGDERSAHVSAIDALFSARNAVAHGLDVGLRDKRLARFFEELRMAMPQSETDMVRAIHRTGEQFLVAIGFVAGAVSSGRRKVDTAQAFALARPEMFSELIDGIVKKVDQKARSAGAARRARGGTRARSRVE